MDNNKAPGRDLIVGYWIKRLTSTHDHLVSLYTKLLNNRIDLPNWLTLTVTYRLPTNNDTNDPKKYRPIACENNMLKIYTAIIAQIVNEHCVKNNVITLNQAGGKSGSWGYIDQLLINKMITEEVITNRRNLMSIWLDYKKAFDSVPHSWIIESLKLAKVHPDLISAILI